MWAHSHVWGTPFQQSSTACLLEQIDPGTFLDRGGRACHSQSSRDVGILLRLSSEPQLECGDPGSRTWQPISGCLGDNTRQTQTVITRRGHIFSEGPSHGMHWGPGPAACKLPPTTMMVSVQDTRPNSPCRMGIIRPTEGRGTASASLLEACVTGPAPAGTSLWLART